MGILDIPLLSCHGKRCMKQSGTERSMITKGLDSSGMKMWVVSPARLSRPAQGTGRGEGNSQSGGWWNILLATKQPSLTFPCKSNGPPELWNKCPHLCADVDLCSQWAFFRCLAQLPLHGNLLWEHSWLRHFHWHSFECPPYFPWLFPDNDGALQSVLEPNHAWPTWINGQLSFRHSWLAWTKCSQSRLHDETFSTQCFLPRFTDVRPASWSRGFPAYLRCTRNSLINLLHI